MENPHLTFAGVLICSLLLTVVILFSQNQQDIVPMLTIFVPAALFLLAVLFATKKYWSQARSGGNN